MDDEIKDILDAPTQQEIVTIPDATNPIEVLPTKESSSIISKQKEKDIEEDYDYSRKTYQDLVGKGKDALDTLIDLAKASDSPRAYEVVATLIKNLADTTEKIMQLQKNNIEIEQMKKPTIAPQQNIQNNNMFLTTKDLLELVKKI